MSIVPSAPDVRVTAGVDWAKDVRREVALSE